MAVDSRAAPRERADLTGTLLVLAAAALWGTSGLFVKFVMVELSTVVGSGLHAALAMAFWRDVCTFALLFLGLVLLRRSWLRVERSDLKWLAAMGVSLGSFHVVWNLCVFLNGAAVATVQQAAMPAIVAVAARLVWREPLTWAKVGAIVLTFAGTFLVSSPGISQSQITVAGLLVGIAVPFLYATWNLLGKRVRQKYNPFTTLTFAFGFAAACLLPIQFFVEQPFPVPPDALVWFTGLVLLATIVGFCVYFYALGRLQASVATILAMSEIAFVAVYAYLWLNERPTIVQLAGALLVVVGVLLLSWPRDQR